MIRFISYEKPVPAHIFFSFLFRAAFKNVNHRAMCRPIIMLQVLQFRAEVTFGKERRKSYLTSKLRTSTSCIFVNYIYFVSFCISILAAYKFTTKNKSLVLFYQIKFISFKLSYNFKILMSCGFDSHDIILTSTYVLF